MGAAAELPRGAPAAAARSRARRCTASPTSCRSPAPRSSPACSSPACWPRARPRDRAAADPRPHRADARRRRAPRSSRERRRGRRSQPAERLEPGEIVVPADISSAAFFIVAALLVPGSEVRARGRRRSTRPGPACSTILERMGAEIEVEPSGERGGEPIGDLRVRASALRGDRGRRRRGAAGDRRAAAGRPRRLLRRGRRRRSATPPSCGARSPTGSRPSTAALNALGGEVEATEDGMVDRGRPAACAAARSTPTATTASRCSAPSPASPRARASRSRAWTPPRSATRASRPTSPRCSARLTATRATDARAAAPLRCRADGDRDRRPRRGRQVHRRPRRRGRARLHLPRLRGDVPLRGAGGARGAGSTSTTARRWARSPRGLEIELRRAPRAARRARRQRRDPRAARSPPPPRASPSTRRCARRWSPASAQLIAAGRYVAEGRDIGTVVSPDSPLKVFLTASDEERARRRAARDRRGLRVASSPPSAGATPATPSASTAPCAPPTTRSSSTPPGSRLEEVVGRVVALARERGLAWREPAAHRRRRRLPQRRQEHPGQPPGRRQRGRHRAPSPASPATASAWRPSGTGSPSS